MSLNKKITFRKMICHSLTALILLFSFAPVSLAAETAGISGIVRDESGAVVADATVSLLNAQRSIIAATKTDAQGRFSFSGVPVGSYELFVTSKGFTEQRRAVAAREASENVEVTLQPGPITETVTVTAVPGTVESIESVSQQVNLINEREIEERAKSVIAQVATEETGIHLQRTSPTVSGVFVRGLTGNKVNVFIDGIRYSTSTQRGGVSSFFNLIEPTSIQALEVLRGPNSAQYGSDSIGGSLQFLTRLPRYTPQGDNAHGRLGVFVNSADAGFGSNLSTSFATRNFGLLVNVAGHRANTLRTGHERDSHNAVTRFFNLSSDLVIDGRTPDTAFTQYGGMIKMNYSPTFGSQVTGTYIRSHIDGGKRWDQLLGGDGNLIADLRNFMLDFFYLKYDNVRVGWLDSLTLTYSFNSQREERVNQGGNGNPRASINHEYERTKVHGIQAQASKLVGTRNSFLFGADYYHDRLHSPSFGVNPVTNVSTIRRGRVPGNARYDKGGAFIQDVFDVIPERLRLIGNVRYNVASYKARTEDSPLLPNGRRLWPSDSLRVDDWTYRAGVVVTPVEGLSLLANFSRGFRAPHLTDLDTLGLTGSGFEVPANEVASRGATIGSTANSMAVSTGRPVEQTRSETSQNYEVGARFHNRHVDTDFAFFVNDISDNIAKQALILPPGAVGQLLGSDPITAQGPTGVVFVAATSNPVLVRANFDDVRIWGIEHTFDARINSDWSVGTVFTYLHARDKRTDLPPNIEGGTPAPEGWLKIRYAPAGRRWWIEPYVHVADRQERLSTLDLEDRRTGATRSRTSIANFFLNGATARGLVSPGPDGVFGNADDRLIATGETLAQIQLRVLGPAGLPLPLYDAVPGYVTFNVRGGIRFGERHDLLVDFENISDRNYRGISWGLDAPGRGVYARFNTRF
ncbi:MAG TPA: TonB-dependent receptor [Blastocatellia bacterium]|nr:TonB-dependent receptor [Blastocatellia bacterium]